MVEATIVLPIIILVLISLISIVVFMYKNVENNVSTHLALTNSIGMENENTHYYGKVPGRIYVTDSKRLLHVESEAKVINEVEGIGVLRKNLSGKIKSKAKGINEKKYILAKDFIKNK